MIWIVLGCCWVSQIRTKPGKNIWAPLLDSITSYYVQCPWKIVSFFRFFGTLITIFLYFPGVYWLVSDASRLAWTEAIPWASGHVAMAKYGSLGCRIRSKMRWRNKYSFQNFHFICRYNSVRRLDKMNIEYTNLFTSLPVIKQGWNLECHLSSHLSPLICIWSWSSSSSSESFSSEDRNIFSSQIFILS